MPSPAPEANGRWAERTSTAGDLNGDGVNDLWVGVPKAGEVGKVYAVSGADLPKRKATVLYTINSPEPQAGKNFGFAISNLGDVNRDGTPDVVAGTDAQDTTPAGASCNGSAAPEPDGCNEGQGKAWVFSGENGAALYAINLPKEQAQGSTGIPNRPGNLARFGSRVGRAGDVTGDGVPDVIAGSSNNDVCSTDGCRQAVEQARNTPGTQAAAGNLACGDVQPFPDGCRRDEGQAYIFNGVNGSFVRALSLPSPDQTSQTCSTSCGGLGLAVQGIGDANGDGVTDQQVAAPNLTVNGVVDVGRIYLFSGKDGKVLQKIDNPAPQAGATFGFQDVSPLSPGDVNHDGAADVYGQGFTQDGANGLKNAGRAWVFSGKTGKVIYELANPHVRYGEQFGWSMSREQTYYGGGRSGPRGPLYVGASPHHATPRCDSDKDGEADPGLQPGVNCAEQRGETNLFNFPQGHSIETLSLPAPWNRELGSPGDLGPNLGWTVSTPGDLNGDGKSDYAAGAPFTSVGPNQDQGVLIVFVSHP